MTVVTHNPSTPMGATNSEGDPAGNVRADILTPDPGTENPTSSVNSFKRSIPVSNMTIVNKQTAITIGGGVANDTHLEGINIDTALTGTCVITGFKDDAGAAASITLPAGSVGFIDFRGAINSAGALTVTCSNAADALHVQIFSWIAG